MNLNSPVNSALLSQGASSSVDARSLAALRTTSSRDPKAAIKETAKQFEAMFMQLRRAGGASVHIQVKEPMDNELEVQRRAVVDKMLKQPMDKEHEQLGRDAARRGD